MRKLLIFALLPALMLLAACGEKDENIVFYGTVEAQNKKSLVVRTDDPRAGFDCASVVTKYADINVEIETGREYTFTIEPEIRESYPVGVTAVSVDKYEKAAVNETVSAKWAKEYMDNHKDAFIIDVRTKGEYIEGHVAGAVNIPLDEIEESAEKLTENKDAAVLVYCRTGKRSAQAAKKLAELGYTKIYDFGGIADWNYEIEK